MPTIFLSVLIGFAAACTFALLLTPVVIRLAGRLGAVDQPNDRKAHLAAMPRMGGVAVFASFALSIAILRFVNPEMGGNILAWDWQTGVLAGAMALILALGIWDDIRTLGPGLKFVAEIAIASAVYAAGFKISVVSFVHFGGPLTSGVFQYLVTVFWITGVTNAVNLIDGLDGLASGVGMIACLTIAPIAYMNSDFSTAVLALLLAGGLLGFLGYNFNPAKIFLGDSGSLTLGFALALLSIRSFTKASTAFAIVVPILALGLPIMETLVSMLRRFLSAVLPGEGSSVPLSRKLRMMFLPDMQHIHHRLLSSGFSHRKVVIVLYGASCVLGVGAFVLSAVHNVPASLILVVVGIAAVLGIRHLRYTEMAVLRNGVLLPLFEGAFINRETFRGFLDLFFVGGSFLLARQIAESRALEHFFSNSMIIMVALVSVVQFVILLLSGLYRGSIRHMDVREMVRITTTIAVAVTVTGIIFAIVGAPMLHVTFGTIVLDFYLLLTCVLGSRLSFTVLKELSQHGAVEGTRVLLYGAGINGRLILDNIRSGKLAGLVPVGFLDDDPALEGKRFNGLTVFGGHWKLRAILNRLKVDELLLMTDNMKPEILRRINEVARLRGMRVRKLNVSLEEPGSREAIPVLARPAYAGLPQEHRSHL
jgi:UDP-GlcNAc:undecaprenyl-phosphate GlcNAc-1-phosphate transferase